MSEERLRIELEIITTDEEGITVCAPPLMGFVYGDPTRFPSPSYASTTMRIQYVEWIAKNLKPRADGEKR